jgi:hypothetical protein
MPSTAIPVTPKQALDNKPDLEGPDGPIDLINYALERAWGLRERALGRHVVVTTAEAERDALISLYGKAGWVVTHAADAGSWGLLFVPKSGACEETP